MKNRPSKRRSRLYSACHQMGGCCSASCSDPCAEEGVPSEDGDVNAVLKNSPESRKCTQLGQPPAVSCVELCLEVKGRSLRDRRCGYERLLRWKRRRSCRRQSCRNWRRRSTLQQSPPRANPARKSRSSL